MIDEVGGSPQGGSGMKVETGKVGNDIALHRRSWLPAGLPAGQLLLVHGYGEHGGRYEHLAGALAAGGYAVHAVDLRGHGRSPGPRGHILSWQEYLHDIAALHDAARRADPELPLFLFGHSMGGLLVLDYAGRHPAGISGVIASAPALGRLPAAPPLRAVGAALSLLAPGLALTLPGDPGILVRDPAAMAAWRADPLIHGRASARFSTELARAMREVPRRAPEFRTPLLLLHGSEDRLIAPEGSADFYAAAGSPDKERIVYPGARHEPHQDHERDRVARDIVRWLAARGAGRAERGGDAGR